ncbi:hypothetical protein, partial [Lactococcus garvieae]|uniref:hypothetical protein n=1 Tax=Lactococcus garvieae TaxID=1363 RepID=UPI003853E868
GFYFFLVGNKILRKKGGTTTPLLSAECQIGRQTITKPYISRVCEKKISATNGRHFWHEIFIYNAFIFIAKVFIK